MIGIIGAMGIEIEGLRELAGNRSSETVSGIAYTKGTISGREVVLAVCGVGKVAAAVCAQTMILRYAPDAIINTGVAGTLSDRLGIGDIAIAGAVVQHDMDTTAIGSPRGFLQGEGLNLVRIPCPEGMTAVIRQAVSELPGVRSLVGTIASGDQFVGGRERKEEILKYFPDAIACEMEGAAIGQTCRMNGVGFAVIRSISDGADGSAVMEFERFAEASAKKSIAVVLKLLEKL